MKKSGFGPQYAKEVVAGHTIEVLNPGKAPRGSRSLNRVWQIRFGGIEWTVTGFAGRFLVKNAAGVEFQTDKITTAKARIVGSEAA